jgi:predicted DNA-binding protein (MmcQ/YjbR family)
MARRDPLTAAEASLRDFALTFPESTEEFPWDHRAIKVRGKIFLILSNEPGRCAVTVKLPVSRASALELPFAEPTGYGLGKHGWVSANFTDAATIPFDLLREWIDESYRAVAPKTVLAKFEQGDTAPRRRAKPKAKKRAQ